MNRDTWRHIGREPLLHFAILGGLIFAADAVLAPARDETHRIALTQVDLDRIAAQYERQWGRAPSSAERATLARDYVRSEILFREGMAVGLARDDTVLRNRVIQKMELLLQAEGTIEQPSEAELAAYYAAHAEAYRQPDRIAFAQHYFSPALRGDRAESDAAAVLAKPGEPVGGDPFMLESPTAPVDRERIAADYGTEFADALFQGPQGRWFGPVRSSFGYHLVKIDRREAASVPPLAEIRVRVHDDLVAERLRSALDRGYEQIRSRYQVIGLPPDTQGSPSP